MLDLPEEIIALVVSFFELPPAEEIAQYRDFRGLQAEEGDFYNQILASLKALYSLTQVSKTFNRIAEPVLYRVFPGSYLASSYAFLGALYARPERRKSVREIIIDRDLPYLQDWSGRHGDDFFGDELPEDESEDSDADVVLDALENELLGDLDADGDIAPQQTQRLAAGSGELLSRDHIDALKPLIQRVKGSQELRDTLSKNLSLFGEDAVLPLLVLSCSNLETLDICCCPEFHTTLTSWALFGTELRRHEDFVWKMGEAHERNFPHLKTLNIRRAGWAFDNAFTSVAPVLRLPNIESVYVSGTEFRHACQTFKLHWPGITKLEFSGCWVTPQDVEVILDACPKLKKLYLSLMRTRRHAVDCSDLGDILRAKARSLTTLEVDTRRRVPARPADDGLNMEPDEGVWGSLGSLKSLHAMKVLIASTRLLVGPNWSHYDTSVDTNIPLVEARLKDVLPTGLRALKLLAPVIHEKGPSLGEDLAKQFWELMSDARYQELKEMSIQKRVDQELPIASELLPKDWYQKPQSKVIGGPIDRWVEIVYSRKK